MKCKECESEWNSEEIRNVNKVSEKMKRSCGWRGVSVRVAGCWRCRGALTERRSLAKTNTTETCGKPALETVTVSDLPQVSFWVGGSVGRRVKE